PFYGSHQGDIEVAQQNQSFLGRSAPTVSCNSFLDLQMVGFKSVAAASQEFRLEVETTCMLNKLLGQDTAVTNEC
ncbi:hypothetical protein E2320_022315, partial [Naja naja]